MTVARLYASDPLAWFMHHQPDSRCSVSHWHKEVMYDGHLLYGNPEEAAMLFLFLLHRCCMLRWHLSNGKS